MRRKVKYFLLVIISFLIVVQFIPGRVYISDTDVGAGWLLNNNEDVEFVCFGSIYNLSFRPCTVVLDITSKRDVDDGFLSKENLTLKSVEIREGNANILDNHVIHVPPISKSSIQVVCVGEYGGSGNGVRHPPSSIKVKICK